MQYTSELVRVAAPSGTIILTALCHRDLGLDEKSLKPDEMGMLEGLGKSLHIDWCSAADYVKLFESLNVQVINLSTTYHVVINRHGNSISITQKCC